MMRFADVSFYHNRGENDPGKIILRHSTNLEYVNYLSEGCRCVVIKFMDGAADFYEKTVRFVFFTPSRWKYFPGYELTFLRKFRPDIVLVHGFIYPLQVIALKWKLGKQTKIICQHHGEIPPIGFRSWPLRLADHLIDGYFFASSSQAVSWREKKIFGRSKPVFDVITGSTNFFALSQSDSKKFLHIRSPQMFLWVGRLNANKDPLTAVHGFARYARANPAAVLYMIFQTEEILQEVTADIALLQVSKNIILIGKVEYEQLQRWYSAADYFLSCSHREACGYSLIEAMACGCLPVVTDIPSFRVLTSNGTLGQLFEPGNPEALKKAIENAVLKRCVILREQITAHFSEHLSFSAIARQMETAFRKLVRNTGARAGDLSAE
ncbi:MAG TPA: glycosyltransferase family 4 protein [Flavitalea sp.]|nr:glycosyltransferase family 4 protein [Flavitalea sp.]